MRKNKTTKNFTNFKMDNEVYKLRRQVLNIIYEVKNLGVLNKHYYGKTSVRPNKRVGIIDFTFSLKGYSNTTNNAEIDEDIVITTILVNT